MVISHRDTELCDAAELARDKAYAPYSSFKVGAALRSKGGDIVLGCNVENISFGLTICAERSAVVAAIQKGLREFDALALVTDSSEPVVPCGACRQFLAEFNPSLRIFSRTLAGDLAEFELAVLLPNPRQGILR